MSETSSRTLQYRGIGKKYHKMTLTDYPHDQAKDIISYIEDDLNKDLSLGNGIVFFGETQEGYDLALLFARAAILSGFKKLKCFSFHDTLDYEVLNAFWQDKTPVLITNFYPDNSYVDAERYKRLENLLTYYLDNGIPFFLHLPVDRHKTVVEYGNLISPVFMDRLMKNMKTFVIE